VFSAKVKFTAPVPVRLAPDVMVIHGELLTAVHEQLACVVTVTSSAPPAAVGVRLVGETV
jgi:hypothetical protein